MDFILILSFFCFAYLAGLFLIQGALVALIVGIGCIFSSYLRGEIGRVKQLLGRSIKYRLFAVPGVIVFDLLVHALADSSVLEVWLDGFWANWMPPGLLLLASFGLAFWIGFWGKTRQLAEGHHRLLAMEAILSVYICWIGTIMLIGD